MPASPATPSIDRNALARAVTWAEERYHACDVCEARCGVDRYAGPAGVCQLGEHARVYKEYVHYGEEACLIPSHTIYMAGCNFRCVFCSDDAQVRRPQAHGVIIPPAALARRIVQRRDEGARNVNFVGGLPDVNVLYILRTLQHCPVDTHVVWNTNLWTTPEAIDHLGGVVGTWLIDAKFGNDRCARKLAAVTGYWQAWTARAAQLGAAGARILARHLLMPGHVDCCTAPVVAWHAEHLPQQPLNLMLGYHPYRMAGTRGAMGGTLSAGEADRAVSLAARTPIARLLVDGVEYQGLSSRSA